MKKILLSLVILFGGLSLVAQTMMPLSSHSNVYTGQVRGFWFIAPNDFIITGLRVNSSAGTGTQNIQVMKLNSWSPSSPPPFTSQTTAITSLTYIKSATNNVIQSVNILIKKGEIIGVLGQASTSNSYGSGSYLSSINGDSVRIQRFGYQGNINSAATSQCWGVALGSSGSISRVEVYTTPASVAPNDAGVSEIITPIDDCDGVIQDFKVEITNYGTNQIDSVQVNWKINNFNQTPYMHRTKLDTANGTGPNTAIVTLGTVTMVGGSTVNYEAYTSLPNNKFDTIFYNDTAYASVRGFNYPNLNLGNDTTFCPGDTMFLNAGGGRDSLLWSTMDTLPNLNIDTAGTFYVSVYKNGCKSEDTITLTKHPNPPKANFGLDTTICSKDSILLDATTAGVSYFWYDSTTQSTHYARKAGKYWVILEDVNTCKSQEEIELKVFNDPVVVLVVRPGNVICYGIPYGFEALPKTAGSILYQWKVNGVNVGGTTTDSSFFPSSQEVVYGDTVMVEMMTDLCTTGVHVIASNKIEMLINPKPRAINNSFDTDTILENTSKNYAVGLASGGAQYVWSAIGGVLVGDSTSNAIQVDWGSANPQGKIILTESVGGCKRPNERNVMIVSIVGVKDNKESIGIGYAYPNPANTNITIPVVSKGDWDIELNLYDVSGKQVKSIYKGTVHGNQDFTFDVSDLKSGMYFYSIRTQDGYESLKKMSIQH